MRSICHAFAGSKIQGPTCEHREKALWAKGWLSWQFTKKQRETLALQPQGTGYCWQPEQAQGQVLYGASQYQPSWPRARFQAHETQSRKTRWANPSFWPTEPWDDSCYFHQPNWCLLWQQDKINARNMKELGHTTDNSTTTQKAITFPFTDV